MKQVMYEAYSAQRMFKIGSLVAQLLSNGRFDSNDSDPNDEDMF
jgi:hypothetical protein